MTGAVIAIGFAIGVGGGCAVDEPSEDGVRRGDAVARVELEQVEVLADHDDAGAELCGLAAALPASNACSLICDPEAFAARLVADGMAHGACYQLRCDLGSMVVSVGVCLL